MARPIFCRWCGEENTVVAGILPIVCDGCKELGLDTSKPKWSTEPGHFVKERRKNPRIAYELNANDRRLLRAAKIAQD